MTREEYQRYREKQPREYLKSILFGSQEGNILGTVKIVGLKRVAELFGN